MQMVGQEIELQPEDADSDEEGQATYDVRWPPYGDPQPSDLSVKQSVQRMHSMIAPSPRSDV